MCPKVSVVIPVYNRAQSVLPTLESVRTQTMQDFECIVVDDGSRDGTKLRIIVEGLNDARFRYISRDNGGASAARNTGIDEAKSDLIAFLDSDDRWLPRKLETDLASSATHKVLFSRMHIERAGRIVGSRPRHPPQDGEPIADYLARRQGFVPTSTIVVPAHLARRVRYDETLSFGDDADFAIRLVAAGGKLAMQPEVSAIMADDETETRLSRSTDWNAALTWLDGIRPLISRRAYLAYRGWHIARLAAEAGRIGTALRWYVQAVAARAFPPALAAKALAQVLIRRSVYARFR